MVEGKTKFSLFVSPEAREMISDNYKKDNCASQSEYVEKAIIRGMKSLENKKGPPESSDPGGPLIQSNIFSASNQIVRSNTST